MRWCYSQQKGAHMSGNSVNCSVCRTVFEPTFRYQTKLDGGPDGKSAEYYCSQGCHARALGAENNCECSVCGKHFSLEFPFQVVVDGGVERFFCSTTCRAQSVHAPRPSGFVKRARRIAVFNHKGGTGKTTSAVNVAAGFAEQGKRVLLIDADGQGNVGASLGIRGEHTLYHVLVVGVPAEEAAIPVRQNLEVITSNELLAAAELYLASRPQRDRRMRERLASVTASYDVVVIDCAPALSLMNQNALVFADSVLVPVSCDYLSLIGVRQVLRTFRNVRELLKHDISLLGVLPTFFDVRNRIARDAIDALQTHFSDRCLEPIRVNTRLREAPTAKQTIFEYAPESHGAEDYRNLVTSLLKRLEGDALAGAARQAHSMVVPSATDEIDYDQGSADVGERSVQHAVGRVFGT